MRQPKLEARTRPLDRAQQGDKNGPISMSIAVKLRDTEANTTSSVLARPYNRDLKTCRLRPENDLAQ